MLSFKSDFFFSKFTILFFIIIIFGYWSLDLNSEELYIAFSFFLLVIVAFNASRVAMLVFFLDTVNKKYSRQIAEISRIIKLLTYRKLLLRVFLTKTSVRKTYVTFFLTFVTRTFFPLVLLKSQLYRVVLNKFLMALTVNLTYFISINTKVRRITGVFSDSSRFFSIFF